MQEVLGDFHTDRNGVAQLSSIAIATNRRPHSFHRNAFTPKIQMTARGTNALDGFPSARQRHAVVNRLRAGDAASRGRSSMMFDCLCVCHSWFQNEVIDG